MYCLFWSIMTKLQSIFICFYFPSSIDDISLLRKWWTNCIFLEVITFFHKKGHHIKRIHPFFRHVTFSFYLYIFFFTFREHHFRCFGLFMFHFFFSTIIRHRNNSFVFTRLLQIEYFNPLWNFSYKYFLWAIFFSPTYSHYLPLNANILISQTIACDETFGGKWWREKKTTAYYYATHQF